MRSNLLILLSVLLFGCSSGNSEEGTNQSGESNTVEESLCPDRSLNVAILIRDGVYNTELTAPMDIFDHTQYRCDNGMKVFTVAQDGFVVNSFEGLHIVPDLSYMDDSLPDFDVLVIPAAEDHLNAALEDSALISKISYLGERASYVISLCDGAFPLVESGLVDGKQVTTFPGDQDELQKRYKNVNVNKDVSFIRDGKFITSVGGAKSFDACLYLVQELYGRTGAVETANGMVISWDLSEIVYKEFNL